jgi:ABC-type sugar transport system ATPase subunit
MSINSGQLVVIVGANGSGKSTIIKILSRLYDPSSGQILIGGHSSSEYRVNDLRRASVILSQDTSIYPLSLAENIGLGYPSISSDKDMIIEAAKDGGALGFIQKLKNDFNTVLDPSVDTYTSNILYDNKTHPLYIEMNELHKKMKVSGGELQRVAACVSRFLSFLSDCSI